MKLLCDRCEWIGTAPECREHVERETYEFWGQRGTHLVYTQTCPECGNEELRDVCDEDLEEVEDE